MKISGTPCILPGDKSVTRIGLHRRLCIIGTFGHPALPLTVLVGVDHSQGLKLSALKLTTAGGFAEVEQALHQILSRMTARNGRWPSDMEQALADAVEIERIPKLLRKEIRLDDCDYQIRWAANLVGKLGLEHLMAQ